MSDGDIIPLSQVPEILIQTGHEIVQRSYRGNPTDSESRRLRTIHFSLTAEEIRDVNHIVGNPGTGYDQTTGNFYRYAVMCLLDVYAEQGYPDDTNQIKDTLSYIRKLRDNAHMLKIRQAFAEVLEVYETSLDAAVSVGDWAVVVHNIDELDRWVQEAPDKFWSERMRRTIAQSTAVQRAISNLYEASRTEPKLREGAELWQRWLENLT